MLINERGFFVPTHAKGQCPGEESESTYRLGLKKAFESDALIEVYRGGPREVLFQLREKVSLGPRSDDDDEPDFTTLVAILALPKQKK